MNKINSTLLALLVFLPLSCFAAPPADQCPNATTLKSSVFVTPFVTDQSQLLFTDFTNPYNVDGYTVEIAGIQALNLKNSVVQANKIFPSLPLHVPMKITIQSGDKNLTVCVYYGNPFSDDDLAVLASKAPIPSFPRYHQ